MQRFTVQGKTMAIVFRDSEWVDGLSFITEDSDFLQVGMWNYNEGKQLKAHTHKVFERKSYRTQEATYVRSGKLGVDLYDENKTLVEQFVLNEGDVAVFLAGGHGYRILSDGTRVIEFKNGPFLGVEADKELI